MIHRNWWLFFTIAFTLMAIFDFSDGIIVWGVFDSVMAAVYGTIFIKAKEDE